MRPAAAQRPTAAKTQPTRPMTRRANLDRPSRGVPLWPSVLSGMLVRIPLTDDERAAVENDQSAVDQLLERLTDTPTPAGSTPRDLDAADPGRVAFDIEHRSAGADAAC